MPLFVVDLNAQPQAPRRPQGSGTSQWLPCRESPQSSLRVTETGQMPRWLALSNEKPERHKDTMSECPSTEITEVSCFKTSPLPKSLLMPRELEEGSRKLSCQWLPRDMRGTRMSNIREGEKGGFPHFLKKSHFPLWGFVTKILTAEPVGRACPCSLVIPLDSSQSQQVQGAATSSPPVVNLGWRLVAWTPAKASSTMGRDKIQLTPPRYLPRRRHHTVWLNCFQTEN